MKNEKKNGRKDVYAIYVYVNHAQKIGPLRRSNEKNNENKTIITAIIKAITT